MLILNYFKPTQYYKKEVKEETEENFVPYTHPNKKPSWVKDKVMYLKAHLPHDGCRKVAIHFNKIYADKNISVSKSYVYRVLKENGYEILQMRKEMRNRQPYKKEKNQLWHMDLTTIDKMQVFGVVDSGTRALVSLKHLQWVRGQVIMIMIMEPKRLCSVKLDCKLYHIKTLFHKNMLSLSPDPYSAYSVINSRLCHTQYLSVLPLY